MYIDIRHLSNAVRRKRPKHGEPTGDFLLHNNAPAHRSVLVQDFLVKNSVTTLEHPSYFPDTGSSWFLPAPSTEISAEMTTYLWCYRYHKESDRRAEKVVTKWLLGTFPTLLQWLSEVYSWIRGLFWRNCSPAECTVFYISEIKWFQEYFEAAT